MKVLLDTNVLLDIVEKREPFFNDAYQVFIKSAKKEIEAIIGASSVTDVYYVARRNCKDAKQALDHIVDLLKVVNAVDTKAVDLQNAIKLNFPDFEDAVVTATAMRENVMYIITRNTVDFKNAPIRTINPADFLKKYSFKENEE
jgi:predicted nucleic acid-binding protein